MLSKAVENHLLGRYTLSEDPAEIWLDIKRNYAGNTLARRILLKR